MTSRRKNLLLLLPFFVAFFFLGQIGAVELSIWAVLAVAWILAFTVWASPRRTAGS